MKCASWFLVGYEILGPFSNMLRGDHKYSCHNWEKFLQQVHPQLSSKQKTFFQSFILLLKSASNFERFERKDDVHSSSILEVIESEICGYLNARKRLFQKTLWSQPVKWPKTVLKCAWLHFYANFPLISNKVTCVSCLLVGSEILGPSFNMLMADH